MTTTSSSNNISEFGVGVDEDDTTDKTSGIEEKEDTHSNKNKNKKNTSIIIIRKITPLSPLTPPPLQSKPNQEQNNHKKGGDIGSVKLRKIYELNYKILLKLSTEHNIKK